MQAETIRRFAVRQPRRPFVAWTVLAGALAAFACSVDVSVSAYRRLGWIAWAPQTLAAAIGFNVITLAVEAACLYWLGTALLGHGLRALDGVPGRAPTRRRRVTRLLAGAVVIIALGGLGSSAFSQGIDGTAWMEVGVNPQSFHLSTALLLAAMVATVIVAPWLVYLARTATALLRAPLPTQTPTAPSSAVAAGPVCVAGALTRDPESQWPALDAAPRLASSEAGRVISRPFLLRDEAGALRVTPGAHCIVELDRAPWQADDAVVVHGQLETSAAGAGYRDPGQRHLRATHVLRPHSALPRRLRRAARGLVVEALLATVGAASLAYGCVVVCSRVSAARAHAPAATETAPSAPASPAAPDADPWRGFH